jgi:hypothetical protein
MLLKSDLQGWFILTAGVPNCERHCNTLNKGLTVKAPPYCIVYCTMISEMYYKSFMIVNYSHKVRSKLWRHLLMALESSFTILALARIVIYSFIVLSTGKELLKDNHGPIL